MGEENPATVLEATGDIPVKFGGRETKVFFGETRFDAKHFSDHQRMKEIEKNEYTHTHHSCSETASLSLEHPSLVIRRVELRGVQLLYQQIDVVGSQRRHALKVENNSIVVAWPFVAEWRSCWDSSRLD